MPTTQPSTGGKALRYAEETLGVHEIFTECVDARNRLDKVLTDLADLRDKRREAEEALRDREIEVAEEEWANHPEFSATKMDGHLKTIRHTDTFCRAARSKISDIASSIEGLDFDKLMLETDIKIAVARMIELGGYFNYLAAVKQANKASDT